MGDKMPERNGDKPQRQRTSRWDEYETRGLPHQSNGNGSPGRNKEREEILRKLGKLQEFESLRDWAGPGSTFRPIPPIRDLEEAEAYEVAEYIASEEAVDLEGLKNESFTERSIRMALKLKLIEGPDEDGLYTFNWGAR
jgi:hypothetical protein